MYADNWRDIIKLAREIKGARRIKVILEYHLKDLLEHLKANRFEEALGLIGYLTDVITRTNLERSGMVKVYLLYELKKLKRNLIQCRERTKLERINIA